MVRVIKLVLCGLVIVVALWACTGEVYEENDNYEICPLEQDSNTTVLFHEPEPGEYRISEQGSNWTVLLRDGRFIYTVYDHDGNEFFVSDENHRDPRFMLLNEDLLKMTVGAGSNALITQFFDLVQGRYSPEYFNLVDYGHGRVLCRECTSCEGIEVVHDMFDSEQNRNVLEIDFWCWSGGIPDGLPPEIQAELYEFGPWWPRFFTIEFLSPTLLRVEYLNSNAEFVNETITLK